MHYTGLARQSASRKALYEAKAGRHEPRCIHILRVMGVVVGRFMIVRMKCMLAMHI